MIMGSIMGALFSVLMVHLIVYYIDKKKDLGLIRTGRGIITSRSFLIIELINALMCVFVTMYRLEGKSVYEVLLLFLIMIGMAALTVSDYKKNYVPNKVILALTVAAIAIISVAVIYNTGEGLLLLGRCIFGSLLGGGVFLLCYIVSRRRLGAGDVKLAFIMGFCVTSYRVFGAIFYGTLFCSIYSIVQVLRKKIGIKDGVPLVPFLYAGLMFTLILV